MQPHDFVRSSFSKNPSLIELVPVSKNLETSHGHRYGLRAHVVKEIEVPYDRFGLIDKQTFIDRVMGSVALEHLWSNRADVHHLYWPARWYKNDDISTEFREAPSLKYAIPRQMHEYTHLVSQPPVIPEFDTMEQYCIEQRDITSLYSTISAKYDRSESQSWHQHRKTCWGKMLDLLDKMNDGEVGLMPPTETLANMPASKAYRYLRGRARIPEIGPNRRIKGYRENFIRTPKVA